MNTADTPTTIPAFSGQVERNKSESIIRCHARAFSFNGQHETSTIGIISQQLHSSAFQFFRFSRWKVFQLWCGHDSQAKIFLLTQTLELASIFLEFVDHLPLIKNLACSNLC